MQEVWKPIAGFEDEYEVSNQGKVKAKERIIQTQTGPRRYKSRLLKQEITNDGHCRVVLCKAGHQERYFVHRLVALAFIPNPHNYPVVNHLDGNPTNNDVFNLEWTTVQGNNIHAYRMGLHSIESTRIANSVPIIMYDARTHNLIQTFPSMIECQRQTGYALATISYHCKNLINPVKLPVYFRYKEKE